MVMESDRRGNPSDGEQPRSRRIFDEYFVVVVGLDDHTELQKHLAGIVSKDLIHSLTHVDAALKFIDHAGDAKIFFILSQTLAEEHAEKFAKDPRIVAFYIFSPAAGQHAQLQWTFAKTQICSAHSDSSTLAARLRKDIKSVTCRWSFDEKSFQKALTDTSQWYHLFLLIICHRPKYPPERYKTMFHACRNFYHDNPASIEQIKTLRDNYCHANLVQQYTADGFLYRIINNALRTQDMKTVEIFAPFIRDLHASLRELHLNYCRDKKTLIRSVYRGQYVSPQELAWLRAVHQSNAPVITLTTFGSTSLDPEQAMAFTPCSSPENTACLFQILLPDEYNEAQKMQYIRAYEAFANISALSYMQSEHEVLFAPGVHFIIKSFKDPICGLDHNWLPIVLEVVAHVDRSSETNYYHIIEAMDEQADSINYDEILRMLQDKAQVTSDFQRTNWAQWWNQLKAQWSTSFCSDRPAPLHLMFYNCFRDDCRWSRKAVDIYKEELRSIPAVRCAPTDLASRWKDSRPWEDRPPLWIAYFEDYLKSLCDDRSPQEAHKCLLQAATAYQKVTDYERALECLNQASQINRNVQDAGRSKQIDKQTEAIKQLQKKSSGTTKRRQTNRTVPLNTSATNDEGQWRVEWIIKSIVADDPPSIQKAFDQLLKHTRSRETFFDTFDAKIVLRFPLEFTEDLSVNDYYGNFFVAVKQHLSVGKSYRDNAYHELFWRWRYDTYLREWTRLNAVERFVRESETKVHLVYRLLLPHLRRLKKKLLTLITFCFFYICVEETTGGIRVDSAALVDMTKKRMEEAHLNDQDCVDARVILRESLAHVSANWRSPFDIPDHERLTPRDIGDLI